MNIQLNAVARIGSQPRAPAPQAAMQGEEQIARSEASGADPGTAPTSDPGSTATKLRFPWLSRISSELEPVARQKPPFPSVPITGDHIDQAA